MRCKLAERIFALVRGDTLGMGHGISKGMAKRMAAKQALIRLRQNGLPQPQA